MLFPFNFEYEINGGVFMADSVISPGMNARQRRFISHVPLYVRALRCYRPNVACKLVISRSSISMTFFLFSRSIYNNGFVSIVTPVRPAGQTTLFLTGINPFMDHLNWQPREVCATRWVTRST